MLYVDWLGKNDVVGDEESENFIQKLKQGIVMEMTRSTQEI